MKGEDEARAAVYEYLRARRGEIEHAIFDRVRGRPGRGAPGAQEQRNFPLLTAAIASGVGYGLEGVELGGEPGPIPRELILQARRAAHGGTTLESLLHDYFDGYALFCDFVVQAVEEAPPRQVSTLRHLLPGQVMRLDRVLVAVAGAHARERRRRPRPPEARQLACVKRLLAGEDVEPGELAYELQGWHLGAIALGEGAPQLLRDIAAAAGLRLLLVRPAEGTAWGWFGGRRPVAVVPHARRERKAKGAMSVIALGEPGRGIEGWRRTHRQASAALSLARHNPEGVTPYADVCLLASVARDELLSDSLRQLYLAPLSDARNGGVLPETLRAYFAAGRNISSTAAALGVSRQTIRTRLRTAEEELGRTLESCGPEVEVALRLEALEHERKPA